MITHPFKFLIAIPSGTKLIGWKLDDNSFVVLFDVCMHFLPAFVIKNYSKFEF